MHIKKFDARWGFLYPPRVLFFSSSALELEELEVRKNENETRTQQSKTQATRRQNSAVGIGILLGACVFFLFFWF